jgi:tetratricopeptide (TPR) repeat protein
VLYDVLEPVDELYSFRDLRAAREARRLIEHGFGLDEIVEASMVLRQAGRGLFDTSVTEAPWGDLMQQVGSRLGRLNGQLELALEDDFATVDEIFASAEDRELAGDLNGAERLYRIANRIDRADPVIPFNLGNVLDALGRPREAVLSYQAALARDATFVEAWINLAAVQESAGQVSDAEVSLRKALDSSPTSSEALYNLALLLTKAERYHAALPLWNRYVTLWPTREDVTDAVRLRALCQLATESNRHSAGRSQTDP